MRLTNCGREWANTPLSPGERGSEGLSFCTPPPIRTIQTFLMGLQDDCQREQLPIGGWEPKVHVYTSWSCQESSSVRLKALTQHPKFTSCGLKDTTPPRPTAKPLMQTLCGHKNVHVSLYKKVSLHLPWRQELAVSNCSTTWRLLCRMFILKALKKFLHFLQSGVKAFSFCVSDQQENAFWILSVL